MTILTKCECCSITFNKMEAMDTHMRIKHDESEYMRINRLTKFAEAVIQKERVGVKMISFDCTECGYLFDMEDEQKRHFADFHGVKKAEKRAPCGECGEMTDKSKLNEHIAKEHNEYNVKEKKVVGDPKIILSLTADLTDALKNIPVPKEEIVEVAEKQSTSNLLKFMNTKYTTPVKQCNNIKCEEYEKESYPKTDEDNEDNLQGITFKGKSRKYITAYNRLREKMVKGAEFKVKTDCLKIKENPKGKPMKVELSNDNEVKGQAQIQMYKPGKKGATILITRSKGDSFDVVQTIATDFIETFLDALLRGVVEGEAEINVYTTKDATQKEEDIHSCDICARTFLTKHGLNIHMAWHTKRDTDITSKITELKTNTSNNSINPKKMHHSVCEICDMKFTADKKWQTIVELLAHKKTCISHKELNIYRTQQDCDECGYKSKNETDLKHHLRDAHLKILVLHLPPLKSKDLNKKTSKNILRRVILLQMT